MQKLIVKQCIIENFQTLNQVVFLKSLEVWEHIERVGKYTKLLAKRLQTQWVYQNHMTDDFIENIDISAQMHDIWKIWLPDSLLTKSVWFTSEDQTVGQKHPLMWKKIIDHLIKRYWKLSILITASNMALHHHEKYDGTGYPHWLKWDKIPLEARIVTVADVYDSLTSKRSYKEAYSIEKTMKIMKEGKWTHFDPLILDEIWKI